MQIPPSPSLITALSQAPARTPAPALPANPNGVAPAAAVKAKTPPPAHAAAAQESAPQSAPRTQARDTPLGRHIDIRV
jgi:hypothetical protein